MRAVGVGGLARLQGEALVLADVRGRGGVHRGRGGGSTRKRVGYHLPVGAPAIQTAPELHRVGAILRRIPLGVEIHVRIRHLVGREVPFLRQDLIGIEPFQHIALLRHGRLGQKRVEGRFLRCRGRQGVIGCVGVVQRERAGMGIRFPLCVQVDRAPVLGSEVLHAGFVRIGSSGAVLRRVPAREGVAIAGIRVLAQSNGVAVLDACLLQREF